MAEIQTQRMINAETAEEIKNLLVHSRDRESVRPVIWPESKLQDLFDSLDKGELRYAEICQRELAHFVCCKDIIRLLIVRPRIEKNMNLLSVDDLIIPYDLLPDSPVHMITRVLIADEASAKACKEIARKDNQTVVDSMVKIYTWKEFKAAPQMTNDAAAVAMARVLEHYAFSPYTTFKHRPTLKQAMSRNPQARKFSAIEIVNLRIPKRRQDAEPGSGKKLDMRIQVTEHLRRQPTKQGIKLITIAEHWRGPDDAPVKPKTKKVYKVNR